ncbi:hypothetical protein ACNF42_06680 [Cuniculiplasma sp. SKW3]|uniref:hypothetical protein n=1 Tax=Cuniculiplasma sp. SKW3 TaxID=3400170 RepID=UPI003FD13F16
MVVHSLAVKRELRKHGYLEGKWELHCNICGMDIPNIKHFHRHKKILREVEEIARAKE